jgi:RNA polymerase sigma-70 factor (ECF subfamily)
VSHSGSDIGHAAARESAASSPRLTPLRELQLLESYRKGGPEAHRALTELLAGYQRRIFSVCFRMVRKPEDASDLTQDVLMKVVEHLPSYDGRSKLSTWIIRVAMNASLSHLRRAKTRETRSLDSGAATAAGRIELDTPPNQTRSTGLASREPSPAEGVEQNQRRTLVLQALDSLDADTKAILVLRDMQDMDYQQLAEALDVPLGTIKSRLFRARAAFREAFESLGGE